MSSGVRLRYSVVSGTRVYHGLRWRYLAAAFVLIITVTVLFGVFRQPADMTAALVANRIPAPSTAATTTATTPVAATSTAPAPAAPDVAAQATAAVQAATARNTAQSWSVAAYDLTGKQWLVRQNADEVMSSASLYKLYAAYALAQRVPFAQWPATQVAGMPLDQCVDRMLRLSDNDCGDAVAELVGWGTIDRTDRAFGFTGTRLNLPTGPQTTAGDSAKYMVDLANGTLFDSAATSSIMNSLQHQLYRQGIPAGCQDCVTYNKTGNDGNVAHDAAIVESGRLRYAVVIMSRGGSYQKIAHIEAALQAVLVANRP